MWAYMYQPEEVTAVRIKVVLLRWTTGQMVGDVIFHWMDRQLWEDGILFALPGSTLPSFISVHRVMQVSARWLLIWS